MKNNMKLYIVSYGDGTQDGEGVYTLVAENGEGLYSHYCSCRGFARGDLIENRPERIKDCKEKYGTYEVLHLGDDEMTNEELFKRNKDFYKEDE